MDQSTARLSNALLSADLDDFLSPSQACILPLEGGLIPASKEPKEPKEPEGSFAAPIVSVPVPAPVPAHNGTKESRSVKKATVTLSDCLSCSGCITTAETVLLSSASLDHLRSSWFSIESRESFLGVVALSQQSVASLAVKYGHTSLDTTARKLAHFLTHTLHFDVVTDLSYVRAIVLAEAADEFISRHNDNSNRNPVICSACPGWLTYAEKTLDADVLACISTVRSPQAMFAKWAQGNLNQLPQDKKKLWLATIMPCHDKKIEANRPEYTNNSNKNEREIECVLTTGEIEQLLQEHDYHLDDESPESPLFHAGGIVQGKFGAAIGTQSGSGGYAEYIMRKAAKSLLDINIDTDMDIVWKKASRSGDMQSAVLRNPAGKTLSFALAYGFRSLHSVLRKICKGECTYDYIELMACPGGCNNGGGQLVPQIDDTTDDVRGVKARNKAHLKNVARVYEAAPRYGESLSGVEQAAKEMPSEMKHTQIVARKKTTGMASLAW